MQYSTIHFMYNRGGFIQNQMTRWLLHNPVYPGAAYWIIGHSNMIRDESN